MTIEQTLEVVDALRPNTIPQAIKTGWLASLDATLRQSVMAQHQLQGVPTLGMGADFSQDLTTELLLLMPYHEVYHYWLCAQIDFALGEIARYSNSMALYNAALDSFTAAYKAGHRPLPRGQFQL